MAFIIFIVFSQVNGLVIICRLLVFLGLTPLKNLRPVNRVSPVDG